MESGERNREDNTADRRQTRRTDLDIFDLLDRTDGTGKGESTKKSNKSDVIVVAFTVVAKSYQNTQWTEHLRESTPQSSKRAQTRKSLASWGELLAMTGTVTQQ